MADRQAQLHDRFRASAEERLQRCVEELISAAQSGSVPPSVKRDLHTLKGEARLLSLLAVSKALHAAEDVLAACTTAESAPTLIATLAEALAVIAAVLHEGFKSESEYEAALTEVVVELRRAIAPFAKADSAPAKVVSAPSSAPGPVPGPAATVATSDKKPRRERWLQVGADQVDSLFGNISEFSSAMRALHESTRRMLKKQGALSSEARGLLEDFERLGSQLDDIESAAWTLRMVSIEPTLRDLGQHAKELAAELGKELGVIIDSGRSQIERIVLDSLWEPLLHLVRNAVDHGLEASSERGGKPRQGTLILRAETIGRTVVVTVKDDGRGILLADVQKAAVRRGILTQQAAAAASQAQLYELLFHQGFSTRGGISDLSGRGIGLDVVRDRLTVLGGEVTLSSVFGSGTEITLTIPVRLSKERAVLMQIGGMLYALPGRSVLEIVPLVEQTLQVVAGGVAIKTRYGILPLASLGKTLGAPASEEEVQAVIVHSSESRWAFSVPRIYTEMELDRQPCDPLLAAISGTYASALLDNGRTVLWLLASDLCKLAKQSRASPAAHRSERRKQRVMIVDDSAVLRELLVDIFEKSGYEVVAAANGKEALSLCERALPDAALVDVEMPVLDGFEFLKALRPRWPTLPVMMFTSRKSPEYQARALSLGANAYLVKTEFDESRLVEALAELLRGPAS